MAPSTKPAAKSAAAAKAKPAHPSFLVMCQECIAQAPKEDSRSGVSRTAIKKFLADKYKIDMSSKSNLNSLSGALKKGVDTKVFDMPKGASGKVKLVKKMKAPTSGKENAPPKAAAAKPKPASKTATKAPAKKAAPAKAAAKPAAKAAPAKKAAAKPAAKKPLATKASAVKAKAVAKPKAKAAPAKKAPAAKKPVAKKAAAKK